MIVNFWLLPVALLLLWFPRPWFRFGRKVGASRPRRNPTEKDIRDASDVSVRLRDELFKPRNWIDFLRAMMGGVGVMWVCFEARTDAPKGEMAVIFNIQCALLAVAVAIQTMRFQQRLTLVAPIFFVMGLSFALLGWQAGLFTCVTIWVLNLLIPSAGFFLMVFAVLELGFTRVLAREVPLRVAILAAALAAGPVVFSAMTNRRLVKLNKKNKSRTAKA